MGWGVEVQVGVWGRMLVDEGKNHRKKDIYIGGQYKSDLQKLTWICVHDCSWSSWFCWILQLNVLYVDLGRRPLSQLSDEQKYISFKIIFFHFSYSYDQWVSNQLKTVRNDMRTSSFRSCPAEKTGPVCVMMITLRSSLYSSFVRSSSRACSMASDRAFLK